MGFHQIVPLERDGAATILVDRGWIPQKREMPLDAPPGLVVVTGYIRPRDRPGWFSATDDIAARRFYTLDPQVIGATVGIADTAPFTLIALGPPATTLYPFPAQHLPEPANNHLSYVMTWYGLAAALVVIFGAWIRKTQRS